MRRIDLTEASPAAGVAPRPCDTPGCTKTGEFRAPRSRQTLNEHYWFCLEHVRKYNSSWNYYDGMTETEVEADMRRDTVWNRPTWRLGSDAEAARARARAYAHGLGGLHDTFGLFGAEDADGHPAFAGPAPDSPEGRALAVLDLRPPLTEDRLKARYKELVKRHHPDANNGDKGAEERFKRINEAYRTLLPTLAP